MDSTGPTEAEALRAMLECEPKLLGWRDRARNHEEPEQGSELAQDDTSFERHRISETCRYCLAASGEHLRLALDAIHRHQLYPGAHYTVLRSALVGAAQAVWVLSPDEPAERRTRGLRLIAEADSYLMKHYRRAGELGGWPKDLEVQLHDQIDYLQRRIQELTQARGETTRLNVTDVIGIAAREVFTPEEADNIILDWTRMSSDAHVLGWAAVQRSTSKEPVRGTPDAIMALGGSAAHLAGPFVASFRLLRRGWSLYDRRCEGRTTAG